MISMISRTTRLGAKIALVLLLAIQAIAARPATGLAELGAVICCDDRCDRGETAAQASRCCGVDPLEEQLTSASLVVPHPPSIARLQPAAEAEIALSAPDLSLGSPRGRSSPVYLLTRSLLI